MTERWVPIEGYDDLYEISNFGEVRTLNPKCHGRIMSFETDRDKYYVIRLVKFGVRKKYAVHRLVQEHFNGPIPPGHLVHHIDEDKKNNRANNLMAMTVAEHRRLHNQGPAAPIYLNVSNF